MTVIDFIMYESQAAAYLWWTNLKHKLKHSTVEKPVCITVCVFVGEHSFELLQNVLILYHVMHGEQRPPS